MLCFGEYLKIIGRGLVESDIQTANLLMTGIGIGDITKDTVSKLKNKRIGVPPYIKQVASNVKYEDVITYFQTHVRLNNELRERTVCELQNLILNDPTIPPQKKDELLSSIHLDDVSVFLAKTFLYSLYAENNTTKCSVLSHGHQIALKNTNTLQLNNMYTSMFDTIIFIADRFIAATDDKERKWLVVLMDEYSSYLTKIVHTANEVLIDYVLRFLNDITEALLSGKNDLVTNVNIANRSNILQHLRKAFEQSNFDDSLDFEELISSNSLLCNHEGLLNDAVAYVLDLIKNEENYSIHAIDYCVIIFKLRNPSINSMCSKDIGELISQEMPEYYKMLLDMLNAE